jgi:XTP/dITP diphosphohydrolase
VEPAPHREANMNDSRFRLVISSGNRDKLREVAEVMSARWLELVPLSGFPGAPTPKEGSFSLEENALIKARTARDFTGLPSVGDDTGLEVDILDGKPGVFSSRYAGENATYSDNVRKLLEVLQTIPRPERAARFKCVVALALPGGRTPLPRLCWGHLCFDRRARTGSVTTRCSCRTGRNHTGAAEPTAQNRLQSQREALRSLKRHLRKLHEESRRQSIYRYSLDLSQVSSSTGIWPQTIVCEPPT